MVNTAGVWEKTKTGGKAGFDKVWGWADKLGAPVNKLSNKLGSEAFWPTTLDKESDKAARILKSFCKDGFYQEEERPSTTDRPNEKSKQRVLKKIPAEVIRNAKGLAIFTTMRTGLWVSGAGGSGVLVARKEDGTWSPPSGILLHTAGLGFLVGVDIYDCVVVINTQKALNAFSSIRCTLGGEISAVAGPVGMGGVLESELHKRQAPVFTYLKSRGFYAGVQVDGTIIIERTDENERFYGQRIPVADILKGNVRHPPFETRRLLETIRAAEGDSDVDESLIPEGPPPADYEIEDEHDKLFGVPDKDDPDPYGVLALENAGLEIREAGTQKRPASEQFEFKPSPTSPIFNTYRSSGEFRASMDGRSVSRRSSWRTSTMSSVLEREQRNSAMVDMSTQTDLDAPPSIKVPPQLPPRHESSNSPELTDIPENQSTDGTEQDVEQTPEGRTDSANHVSRPETSPSPGDPKSFQEVDLDDDADDEEPIIHEVQQATAPQVITRARVVTVPKAIPPKLPPRNPFRQKLSVDVDGENSTQDASAGPSPMAAHSPPSTPSLKHDGSDESSKDSVTSIEGLEHVSNRFQPRPTTAESEKKDDKEYFHSMPPSPSKDIPGSFN